MLVCFHCIILLYIQEEIKQHIEESKEIIKICSY